MTDANTIAINTIVTALVAHVLSLNSLAIVRYAQIRAIGDDSRYTDNRLCVVDAALSTCEHGWEVVSLFDANYNEILIELRPESRPQQRKLLRPKGALGLFASGGWNITGLVRA